MRINAYVLAADPAWVEESVRSYYDLVDKIVVSFDESGISWSGVPLDPQPAIDRLLALDSKSKMVLSPGNYAVSGLSTLDRDTNQRVHALSEAQEGADWVVQVDTDEVLLDQMSFLNCILEADNRAFDSVEYPARQLFQHAGGDRYLERCRFGWRVAAGYPGPVAVRAGARLIHCRQGPKAIFRVDFRARNTDPEHGMASPVHRIVRSDQGIVHYSWVRGRREIVEKTQTWGHAGDWTARLRDWEFAAAHPYTFAARTLVLSPRKAGYRVARIPSAPNSMARYKNGLRA